MALHDFATAPQSLGIGAGAGSADGEALVRINWDQITAEAVNIVLGERNAALAKIGPVDLTWITGENFRTMGQADLVWCGYADVLPTN